jgi:ribosomal protein L7/L12
LIQSFECPNCGAPLDLSTDVSAFTGPTLRCPYCSSTVIVPPVFLEGWQGQADEILTEATGREVRQLIAAGRKIEAIRLYRQRTNASLKEAKEAVERIERDEPVQLTQVLVEKAGRSQVTLPEIEAELRQLLQSGMKVEAIKRYREIFGEGLSASRDAVEVFANGEDLPIPIGWGHDQRLTIIDTAHVLAQVTFLTQQGDRLAAIQTYREMFDSSLQEAEQVVARLAQAGESDPAWVVTRVQSDLASKAVLQPATVEKKGRAGSCLYAGVAVFMIAAILLPLLVGLAQAGGPLQKTWKRLNPAAYARLMASFGGEGTGPGQFSDPRALAVGRDGSLYVGDYQDGRIQRFTSRGQFLHQWFIVEESYLGSLAVDRNNQVYATYRGQIWRFDGDTGEALEPVPNPADLYFDYIVLTPDGSLLAAASGEDLVRLDKSGRIQWIVEEAISNI